MGWMHGFKFLGFWDSISQRGGGIWKWDSGAKVSPRIKSLLWQGHMEKVRTAVSMGFRQCEDD
jgi:hypothetical protein